MKPSLVRAALIAIGGLLTCAAIPARADCSVAQHAKPGDFVRVRSAMFNFRTQHIVARMASRKIPLFRVLGERDADVLVPTLPPQSLQVSLVSPNGDSETCGEMRIERTASLQIVVALQAGQVTLLNASPSQQSPSSPPAGTYRFNMQYDKKALREWLPQQDANATVEVFGEEQRGRPMGRVKPRTPMIFTFVVPNPETDATIAFEFFDATAKEFKALNTVRIPAGGRL